MKPRITRSIVPNLLTLANLFAGFLSIVYSSQGNYSSAAIFIFAAAVFDMLDGFMARLINAASEFGVELDSLCDAVSFGIAPSFLLYQIYFHELGELGILVSALPALLGVVRLARFNVQIESLEDKKYFIGFPIPSNALMIVSYVIFYHLNDSIPEQYKPGLIWFITLVGSLAMVSMIKFANLPRPTKKYFKENPIFSIIFIIALILSILSGGELIFPFFMVYLLHAAILWLIVWFRTRREPEDEMDDYEIDEY